MIDIIADVKKREPDFVLDVGLKIYGALYRILSG